MPRPPLPPLALLPALFLVSCGASLTGGHLDGGADAGPPVDGGTWYHDVQPVVQAHCEVCHQPGDIAPFSLTSYAEAYPQHVAMAQAVASGLMPPWKPSPACVPVKDARGLDDAGVQAIVRWSQAGAPLGDPASAPPPPDAGVKGLPVVSASLTAAADYTPSKAAGLDDYHCLVLDPGLTQATDVVGIDVQPGVRELVHHVIVFHAKPADVQAKAGGSTSGWTCFGSSGVSGAAMVGGWVPGTSAQVFPATTGIRIPAGNLLVMQVHYNLATAAPRPDRTVVKLMYAPQPVARPAAILGQYDFNFSIPAGAQGYTHGLTTTLPIGGTVWGALPHMHTLGRRITVKLDNQCLIDIPDWDFHWQQLYFFEQPVAVTAGTQVSLSCTWDNPRASAVGWGEGTSDEMCLVYLYATL